MADLNSIQASDGDLFVIYYPGHLGDASAKDMIDGYESQLSRAGFAQSKVLVLEEGSELMIVRKEPR